ncbi:MAG: acylphosphatase [Salinispira sp.]
MEVLRCIVSGRVQGVGFRYSALAVARSLKLRGWVRNLPNGSVETRAYGSREDIDAYIEWLADGPPM